MSIASISRGALKQKIARGDQFILVDTLSPEVYRTGRLPGAINVPYGRVEELSPTLLPDKEAEIVVYCSSPT